MLLWAACPGDLPSRPVNGGGNADIYSFVDGPAGGSEQGGGKLDTGPPTEQGLTKDTGQPTDSGQPTDKAKLPDSPPLPDQALPPDKGGGTGATCPPSCKSGFYCYNSKCRKICTDGTDACKVVTVCKNDEGCFQVSSSPKLSICLKGTAPGKSCASKTAYCGSGHVCGSYNSGPFLCLPVCNKAGAACGSGGVCAKSKESNCKFCSKP